MSRTVSFCFDDGFRITAGKVWTLFAEHGVGASFCVLAAPELSVDPYIRGRPIADWGLWREASAAGHEVAPHGWAHERLGDLTLEAACAGIDRTLDAFGLELPDFDPRAQIFHLAHLAAPQGVVDHLATRVLGVRRGLGRGGLNVACERSPGGEVDCITFGDPADERLTARIDRFLESEEGWLVLVLHGLDGEGWGPVSSRTLAGQVDRLLAGGVRIAPAGQVLREAIGS